MQKMSAALIGLSMAILPALPGQAAGLLAFQEVGDDVVATLSGSLTFPEPRGPGLNVGVTFLNPQVAFLYTTPQAFQSATGYDVIGPDSFGPGGANSSGVASAGTTGLALQGGFLGVDNSYVSGTALTGMITWADASFVSLGLTVGEYVFSLVDPLPDDPNPDGPLPRDLENVSIFSASNEPAVVDTYTIRIGNPEVIPLPAAGLLLIGGLGALAMVRRRKG